MIARTTTTPVPLYLEGSGASLAWRVNGHTDASFLVEAGVALAQSAGRGRALGVVHTLTHARARLRGRDH